MSSDEGGGCCGCLLYVIGILAALAVIKLLVKFLLW